MERINTIRKNHIYNFRQGVTLIEVMMALIILMLTIIPVISAFSKYYGVSSKQLDQEIALKITEAAMNKLLSAKFSSLNGGTDNIIFPLDIQTPAGVFAGEFKFSGNSGHSDEIQLGANKYKLVASTSRVFEAQDPLASVVNSKALQFRYIDSISGSPATATYYCTDDMIVIQMDISYGINNKQLSMITFRADMTK